MQHSCVWSKKRKRAYISLRESRLCNILCVVAMLTKRMATYELCTVNLGLLLQQRRLPRSKRPTLIGGTERRQPFNVRRVELHNITLNKRWNLYWGFSALLCKPKKPNVSDLNFVLRIKRALLSTRSNSFRPTRNPSSQLPKCIY